MMLREFGRASLRRARWIFVEVLLALRAAARAGVGAAAHRLREVRRLFFSSEGRVGLVCEKMLLVSRNY